MQTAENLQTEQTKMADDTRYQAEPLTQFIQRMVANDESPTPQPRSETVIPSANATDNMENNESPAPLPRYTVNAKELNLDTADLDNHDVDKIGLHVHDVNDCNVHITDLENHDVGNFTKHINDVFACLANEMGGLSVVGHCEGVAMEAPLQCVGPLSPNPFVTMRAVNVVGGSRHGERAAGCADNINKEPGLQGKEDRKSSTEFCGFNAQTFSQLEGSESQNSDSHNHNDSLFIVEDCDSESRTIASPSGSECDIADTEQPYNLQWTSPRKLRSGKILKIASSSRTLELDIAARGAQQRRSKYVEAEKVRASQAPPPPPPPISMKILMWNIRGIGMAQKTKKCYSVVS
ncbi:hypothetical protein Salat_2549300 [Sesamum alatum]|uniref:Uncharacterized protein n=1 Tax=Sesamum alatum TaxID=300844 RepID=A0AAE1XTB3_9LAMI|nr:hypothetical protein Salat_2549300 [Sesamum alatum]